MKKINPKEEHQQKTVKREVFSVSHRRFENSLSATFRNLQRASTYSLFLALALFGAVFSSGCQANQQIVNSGKISPTPVSTAATKKTSVEQELRDMQTVDFDYVFVVRRKDGGVFDSEDRKFLRQNTPPETNRFVSADEEKAFVIGSAFRFPPENIEALKQRFNVEDFSKPEAKAESNSQTNLANKQTNQVPTNAAQRNTNK